MSKDGMTRERWAHIKQLQPAKARWFHIATRPLFNEETGEYLGYSRGVSYRKPKDQS